jgi:osmoprotectant transport system permease protein
VALNSAYGNFHFRELRQLQPTFMYQALKAGDVDVISAFSSDGRIAADNLVLLTDPRHAIPPYDAVLLLSPRSAADPVLRRAFEPLIGRIPIDLMRNASLGVDRDKLTPSRAAQQLSAAAGLR